MNAVSLLIGAVLAAGPAVTVVPLSGDTQGGTLTTVSAETVQIEAAHGPQSFDLNSLRALTFTAVAAPDEFADPPLIEVRLVDGTRLACTGFAVQHEDVRLTVEDLGEVTLPRAALRAVRLASPEKIAPRWDELLQRENNADLLVVRKQDALDFVEGFVGDIGPSEIKFLLQEQSRTLPRDRAFGVVFAQSQAELPRPALATYVGRSTLQAASLTLVDDGFSVALAAGSSLTVPVNLVRRIDFAGRIRYLGDLTPVVVLPEGVESVEQFRYFRRGSEPFGAALRIGADEVIDREGLWMHSGVTARYRINRDYRQLLALVGMDHNVGGNRRVRLVITGDGRSLFDETIEYTQPAREIELDVAGVRDLEIKVESPVESRRTNIFGIQEHLDFGQARLVR